MANSNTPQAGQWFYIQSKFPDSNGNTQLVTVQGAGAWPGATIQLWPLQPNSYEGLPSRYNGLWQYKNGTIVSAIGSQDLVMDASSYINPNTWVVLNSANGNSSQQWTFNDDGTITNQSNSGPVLDIGGASAGTGEWLKVDAAAQGSPTQQWSVVYPQVFVPKWSYIQSGLTEDPANPLVATLQEGTSNVVLSPMQANFSNQLWQITPDGRILSATSGNPVVTLGSQLDGENGNYIVTAPSPAITESTLQWIFNDQNMFINASNGLALNVMGSSANQNTPLIAYAVQSGPPNNEFWSITPASTMTVIMAMPPVSFPPFNGYEGTAYTYICQQLGFTDLRSEYTNYALDLSTYVSLILHIQCPPPPNGVSQADWNTDWNIVVKQLTTELTAQSDIKALFQQYSTVQSDIFTNQNAQLSALVTDAGMTMGDNKTNVNGIVLAVFENVIYTGLEAMPGVGAVLGNVMETGINIGLSVANRGGGSISPDPFQCTVSELEGQLSTNFLALLTATSNMEDAIMTDWGKMEATETAIRSTGPGSLAWEDDLTTQLVAAAMPGYTLSVMQMLLPAKYQIFQYQANDDTSPIPEQYSSAQWVQSIGNNTWNKYWIATPGNWNEYPSDEAMQDVWGAGVAESDFFQGLAGWGFARCYPSKQGPSPGVDCNGLVITITNQTPNPLTVNASPNDGQGVTVNGPSTQTLQPYGSVSFIGYYTSALAIDITITDPNLDGADPVASFTAHQHDCVMAAGDVWVDSPSTSTGYQLTTPICNPGSYANSFPGTVQTGICLAAINTQGSN